MTSLRVVITSVAQRNEGKKKQEGRRVDVTQKTIENTTFSVEIRALRKSD